MGALDLEEFKQLVANNAELEKFLIMNRGIYTPMGDREKFREVARPYVIRLEAQRSNFQLGNSAGYLKDKFQLESKLNDEYLKVKK